VQNAYQPPLKPTPAYVALKRSCIRLPGVPNGEGASLTRFSRARPELLAAVLIPHLFGVAFKAQLDKPVNQVGIR
jgi:hypothetical protein